MRVHLPEIGRDVTLPEKPMGQGGEGEVYHVPGMKNVLVKIVPPEARTDEFVARIEALIRWQHRDKRLALPTGFVLDRKGGGVVGYTMPYFEGVPLLCAYDPIAAEKHRVSFGLLDRLTIGEELCGLIHASRLVGLYHKDINPSNFLIRPAGLFRPLKVSGIDCLSLAFRSRDTLGRVRDFKCIWGQEPYLAPEIQGKNLREVDLTEESDNHSIAELLWQTVKDGAPSHAVHALGTTPVPPIGEMIREGLWPYAPASTLPPDWHPVDAGVPWKDIPKEVQDLFLRAFHDGYLDPSKRPSPEEWREAFAAWKRRERTLQATAKRIIRAIRALSWARVVSGLRTRLTRFPFILSGYQGRSQRKDPFASALSLVLLTSLVIAVLVAVSASLDAHGGETG